MFTLRLRWVIQGGFQSCLPDGKAVLVYASAILYIQREREHEELDCVSENASVYMPWSRSGADRGCPVPDFPSRRKWSGYSSDDECYGKHNTCGHDARYDSNCTSGYGNSVPAGYNRGNTAFNRTGDDDALRNAGNDIAGDSAPSYDASPSDSAYNKRACNASTESYAGTQADRDPKAHRGTQAHRGTRAHRGT